MNFEKNYYSYPECFENNKQIRFIEFILVDEFTNFGGNWIEDDYEGVAMLYGRDYSVGGIKPETLYMVKLQGTDDCSYTIKFETEEEMLKEVEFVRNSQPINFEIRNDYCLVDSPLFRHYKFTN